MFYTRAAVFIALGWTRLNVKCGFFAHWFWTKLDLRGGFRTLVLDNFFEQQKRPTWSANAVNLGDWWSCRILPPGPNCHGDTILRA